MRPLLRSAYVPRPLYTSHALPGAWKALTAPAVLSWHHV